MERYLGESDWDDLDLITADEARYRFDAEIAELRLQIEGTAPDPDGGQPVHDEGAIAAARARLALLLDAQERLSHPRPSWRSETE